MMFLIKDSPNLMTYFYLIGCV